MWSELCRLADCLAAAFFHYPSPAAYVSTSPDVSGKSTHFEYGIPDSCITHYLYTNPASSQSGIEIYFYQVKEENLFAHRWHKPFLFSFRVLFPGLLLRRGVDWPFEEAIWEHCPSLQGLQSPRTACTLQPFYNPSVQLFVLFPLDYPIYLRKKEYHQTLFQWKST